MFEGFDAFDVDVDGVAIHGVRGGNGPPVLLLHGFPQSHVMWHRIAPGLADEHTVVATDLRGYGRSGHPSSGPDHAGYSFRAMAADQVALMSGFGFDRFAVVGHDRGARVTHRMALDHPGVVERLALLDILPTAYLYDHVDRRFATAYYHWFFFIQPYDLPERLMQADPLFYLRWLLGRWGGGVDSHHPEALAEYEHCFSDPRVRHAMMEDYRAGASIDLEHDASSAAAGERVMAPTLVMWGGSGVVARNPEDPLQVWRRLVSEPGLLQGHPVAGAGHYLADDRPEETLAGIAGFLKPEPD